MKYQLILKKIDLAQTPPLMSALGQKRTRSPEIAMSALPPKADIVQHGDNIRFVPKADIHRLIRSPRRRVRHCRLGLSILRLKVSAFGEHERCRHVIAHELVKLLDRKQLLFDAKCRQFFPNCG